MESKVYRTRQLGFYTLIPLGFVVVFTATMAITERDDETRLVFAALCILFLGLSLIFGALAVDVSDSGVYVRFGPLPLIRRRFALTDINEATPVRNSWLLGWGVRWIPGGWMFNVSGLRAVELDLSSGSKFRIGTDNPESLAEEIRERLRSARDTQD